MSDEQINKAIKNASGNVKCETSSSITKQELEELRKALIKETETKSTIYSLIEVTKRTKK